MTISKWTNAGTLVKMNAFNYPDKLGWQDLNREHTFKEWDERSCRVANALKDIGVGHQEPFAVLAYNRGEWMDIYAGCAKGGQMVVPIMFRLAAPDIEYIVNHCKAKALIVEEPFVEMINGIKDKLPVPKDAYVYVGDGPVPDGYIGFEDLLAKSSPDEPEQIVDSADIWTIMYTSGTTGRPKGVMKTHESYMAQYYLNDINMGLRPTDKVMLVMPMCHVNSIFYSFPYTLVSAPVFVYNMVSFDPENLLNTVDKYKITFTSLVPTHYIMMLGLPDDVKNNIDVSSMRQLLISSAPARKDLKLAIMEYFKNAELWEAYGTTEGGLVTLLRPEDQFKKLGSIGKEIFGTDRIKILDEERKPVPPGEVGELYYRTPMIFKEYLNEPEKSKGAFFGEWSSAGDMVKIDEDGYYTLVDRKANMIITGGENVYPSEIEDAVGAHEAVRDLAVIGIPDDKWGEAIKAIIVLNDGFTASDDLAAEIKQSVRGKLAGFKVPKTYDFIKDEDMPRTGTGKILHRILREKYGTWADK
ncbi:MAG: AMP-binding protein [Thermodesulfobacteriota bacterium]|nr:AMP-binding protein [Thermodesulfobacteriota bacterium]